MDVRDYDQAFVEKIGATLNSGKGWFVQVTDINDTAGDPLDIPVEFDLPEEWWDDLDEYGVQINPTSGDRALLGINVKRVDIVPNPSRFLPNYKAREISDSEPNTWNYQAVPSQPVTMLYEVQMAAESQHHMNQLLEHMVAKMPMKGFGTVLTVSGRKMPFRINSIRNETDDETKGQRKFVHCYTYAVDAWLTSTECEKIKQVLSVDITFEDYDPKTFEETVTVTDS